MLDLHQRESLGEFYTRMIKIRVMIFALLFAILGSPIAAIASDVTNALYSGTITISNNSTATTNVATVANISTDNLIAGQYLNATANNTVMRNSSGADVPFMPGYTDANLWSMWVPSIGANSYLTYILYTANSTGGEIRYFPGAGGMTTTDNASLELSDNFTIEQKGWVNTDAGADKNLIYKQDAFQAYISGAGDITARVLDTGNSNPADSMGGANHAMRGWDAVYLTAHDQAVADDVIGQLQIGQDLIGGPLSYVIRGVVLFDTSAIPDDATITSAVLHLVGTADNSAVDFDVVIRNGMPARPSDPLVVADFDYTFYTGDGGSINTVAWNAAGDNPITLNADGLSWINLTGTTKFALVSSRDISATPPAGQEHVTATHVGTTLTVNYTDPIATVTAIGISSGNMTVTTGIVRR